MSDPDRGFLSACDRAGVLAAHRDALWRLYREWPSSAEADDRRAEVLADYGHWQLYRASRDGDLTAARRFEQYWRAAAATFLGRGFSRDQVDEFIALFFARVYERAHVFAWATPFSAYLRTILLNIARDEIRRLRRARAREAIDDREGESELARLKDPRPSAEAEVLAGERTAAMTRALDRLPPVDRQILLAFVVEEQPGERLAAALGIGRDALYQRLRRARQRLRALFDEEMSGS